MNMVSVVTAVNRSTPHPVPIPKGEGTPELLSLWTLMHLAIQASLLPWGEGQDEGLLIDVSHQHTAMLP